METVHLFDPAKSNSGVEPDSVCGKLGQTRSWHEIKRGGITCAQCLTLYGERETPHAPGKAHDKAQKNPQT